MTPHQTTIQRLFRRVSVEEVETAFRQIFLSLLNHEKKQRGACAVSIDGKVQKGRWAFEEKNGYPIHAVSLVDHETGIVLAQGHVQKNDIQTLGEPTESEPTRLITEAKEKEQQEEKKQKSELAVASRLIEDIDWNGKVLTGDAL